MNLKDIVLKEVSWPRFRDHEWFWGDHKTPGFSDNCYVLVENPYRADSYEQAIEELFELPNAHSLAVRSSMIPRWKGRSSSRWERHLAYHDLSGARVDELARLARQDALQRHHFEFRLREPYTNLADGERQYEEVVMEFTSDRGSVVCAKMTIPWNMKHIFTFKYDPKNGFVRKKSFVKANAIWCPRDASIYRRADRQAYHEQAKAELEK